jgi:hypothetical protein
MLRLATNLKIQDQKQKIDDLKTRQLDLVTDEMRSIRGKIGASYAESEVFKCLIGCIHYFPIKCLNTIILSLDRISTIYYQSKTTKRK